MATTRSLEPFGSGRFLGLPSTLGTLPDLEWSGETPSLSQTRWPGRRPTSQSLPPKVNFSDTSSFKSRRAKGSIGHAFTVCIRTENQNQMSFYPFVPHEISVLVELILGHLRYLLTDVPPQPNSPPDNVFHPDRRAASGRLKARRRGKPRLRLME